MGERTASVAIGIPTYRRPEDLRRLLAMLDAHVHQAVEAGYDFVRVVVVDNDPERSAAHVAVPGDGVAVRYVPEPRPGIAAVRNRLIAECDDVRLLAMIDDDELPQAGWLINLLDTWASSGAAGVAGRVVASFADELDPWLDEGRFFVRRSLPTGTRVSVAAAGNLMLDLDQVRSAGVRFDESFGLSGGEDTKFTRELSDRTAPLVWCDESVIVDCVPVERMTRRWVLERSRSHGNVWAVIEVGRLASPWARTGKRAELAVGGAARIAAGALRWCLGTATGSRRHQARGLRGVYRGSGIIVGAGGLLIQEYARERRARVRRVPRSEGS